LLASAALAVLLLAAWSVWPGRTTAAGPGTSIVMTDYAFSPDRLTWQVGQRVTLSVVNRSQSNPPRAHELMFGRRPIEVSGPFGLGPGDGFEDPLLGGVAIELLGGGGLTTLMTPGSELSGVDPASLLAPGSGGQMPPRMDQFMGVLPPAASLTFSFVVPDRPGEWEFGCFAQDGQHYLNGMRGTVTIVPAGSRP